MKMRVAITILMSLALTAPAFGETYKTNYPIACKEVWDAVKDTLAVPENYTVKKIDEPRMTADYQVKHAVHVTVTGALLQRTNHVKLVPKDNGCEMQVVSNYSGFEHNDRGDFQQRVEDSMARLKAAKTSEPDKPEEQPK